MCLVEDFGTFFVLEHGVITLIARAYLYLRTSLDDEDPPKSHEHQNTASTFSCIEHTIDNSSDLTLLCSTALPTDTESMHLTKFLVVLLAGAIEAANICGDDRPNIKGEIHCHFPPGYIVGDCIIKDYYCKTGKVTGVTTWGLKWTANKCFGDKNCGVEVNTQSFALSSGI
ncbi:uncharacterized protein RAG0_01952 [Rhynchosporium agropyri]|uniref:Uncharacterized protein n=1 Tax=Rhynchosporium agropyri TaxID=914238 RepID=A0A1E1JZD8_9HELO|nr:uncharacterized protein RAG0_01952 [Rhynchosporium agropyri]